MKMFLTCKQNHLKTPNIELPEYLVFHSSNTHLNISPTLAAICRISDCLYQNIQHIKKGFKLEKHQPFQHPKYQKERRKSTYSSSESELTTYLLVTEYLEMELIKKPSHHKFLVHKCLAGKLSKDVNGFHHETVYLGQNLHRLCSYPCAHHHHSLLDRHGQNQMLEAALVQTSQPLQQ